MYMSYLIIDRSQGYIDGRAYLALLKRRLDGQQISYLIYLKILSFF